MCLMSCFHCHQICKCIHHFRISTVTQTTTVSYPGSLTAGFYTTANHLRQARSYLDFCKHYHLTLFNLSLSPLCCYITFVTHRFTLASSIGNYVSGVTFVHKELGLQAQELHSFPVSCMLKVPDLTMQVQPLHLLPILPGLLHQLCSLADDLGPIALAMKIGTFSSHYVYV